MRLLLNPTIRLPIRPTGISIKLSPDTLASLPFQVVSRRFCKCDSACPFRVC